MKAIKLFLSCSLLFFFHFAFAEVVVPMHLTSNNQAIGTVTLKDEVKGLVLIPDLHHLPPGKHGFHVHEHASCESHGEGAGGHLDPAHTGKHLGPYRHGHLGDLPVLQVNRNGKATKPMIAPRLKVSDVLGHTLMIHAGGDNYSDQPQKLGGGGSRIACGIVSPKKRESH